MFVLTGEVGETIAIGSEIGVTITRIDGGAARVGVAAPRATAVHRGEALARIHRSAGSEAPGRLRPAA